jgi:hypothetical protein
LGLNFSHRSIFKKHIAKISANIIEEKEKRTSYAATSQVPGQRQSLGLNDRKFDNMQPGQGYVTPQGMV